MNTRRPLQRKTTTVTTRTPQQQEEWEKCKKDPIYFIENYCYISNPTLGTIKFKLYPFQRKLIKDILTNKKVAISKSRQMGISTTMAGFSLWLTNFYPSKSIAIVATDLLTASETYDRALFMYDECPTWLKEKHKTKNTKTLKLANNSRIRCYAHNKKKGVRSLSASFIIMDECAFIEKVDSLYRTVQPTLRTGGQLVALSSPDVADGWFYEMYSGGVTGENDFYSIKLPWYLHPDQQLPDGTPNYTWREAQDRDVGKRAAKMEYDAEFGFSNDTFFDPEFIESIELSTIKDPIRKENKLWIWEDPIAGETYITVVDVAEGGADNHVVDIYKLSNMEQVAQYVNNEHYTQFGYIPVDLATRYNMSLLVIEANSVGTAVVQRARDLTYPHLYIRGADRREKSILGITKTDFGWKTTPKTRPIVIETLRSFVETEEESRIIFRSARTLKEMKSFKMISGKPQAGSGTKDDTIMTSAIFSFMYSIRGASIAPSAQATNDYLDLLAMANDNVKRNYDKYKQKEEAVIERARNDDSIVDLDAWVKDNLTNEIQEEEKINRAKSKMIINKVDRSLRKQYDWLN